MKLLLTILLFLSLICDTYAESNFTIVNKQFWLSNLYSDLRIYPHQISRYANGAIKCGIALPNSHVNLFGQRFDATAMRKVCFHRNGIISYLHTGNWSLEYSKQGQKILANSTRWQFGIGLNENSEIISAGEVENFVALEVGDSIHEVKGNLRFDEIDPDVLLYASDFKNEELVFMQGKSKKISGVRFYKDGTIKRAYIAGNFNLAGKRFELHANTKFYQNGNIKETFLDQESDFIIAGKKIRVTSHFHKDTPVFFHKNGSFKKGYLAEPVELTIQGKFFKAYDWIEFASSGQVVAARLVGIDKGISFRNGAGININCGVDEYEYKFFPSGALRSCVWLNSNHNRFSLSYISNPIQLLDREQRISFNEKGDINSGSISDASDNYLIAASTKIAGYFVASENNEILEANLYDNFSLMLQGKIVQFGAQNQFNVGRYKFFPTENNNVLRIREGQLAQDVTLDVIGGTRDFYQGETICVNEDGFAASKMSGECNW